jgi:hypothetical protein
VGAPGRSLLAAFLVAAAGPAVAQPAPAGKAEWSGSVAGYLYLQEEDNFLMPVLRADRGSLHLEGRFQYEDLETGSVWAGRTFSAGTSLQLEVVPMAGLVFGRTDGFAPGLELTVSWKNLELYSENEYLFDFGSADDSYFYSWSELGWQAWPWLRLGLAAQRTRVYESEVEIDRGAFAAVSRGPVELVVYGFNLDGDEPFAVVSLAVEF